MITVMVNERSDKFYHQLLKAFRAIIDRFSVDKVIIRDSELCQYVMDSIFRFRTENQLGPESVTIHLRPTPGNHYITFRGSTQKVVVCLHDDVGKD